jgi:DNA polymerase-3 subunit delta
MPELSFSKILEDLKNGTFYPVYFLHGEEPYFIDEIVNYFENNVIDESMRDFNQTVIYGRDVNAREVADFCRRFPMMGDKQLVLVKEAQELTANNRKLDDLLPYIENPLDSTVLVMAFKYKNVDKRRTFYNKLKKSLKSVIFESKKIYDNQIPNWIENHINSKGYKIDPVSTQLLADHVGNDLGRLVNEIDKLTINLGKDGVITSDLIEKNIGISKDYNVFEFTKALGSKDVFKAQQIVKYFEANPKDNPLQMITVILYNFFIKTFLYHRVKGKNKYEIAGEIGVRANFIGDYAIAARNYPVNTIRKIIREIKFLDLKSKGYGATDSKDYGPLSEFVYKCVHNSFLQKPEQD